MAQLTADPARSVEPTPTTPSRSDLSWLELRHGRKPGDRIVRIATHRSFNRSRSGYLVARDALAQPGSPILQVVRRLKRVFIGNPIPTEREAHERLTKTKALAVFSSDALSSVAYATEEIMKVLVLGGLGLLSLTLPISLAIVALLAIVVLSYRQTIRAYPYGGGSYIVASENLGTIAGLTAAGSLMTDYVLTVAVSIAAGVAAITSLAPVLLPYELPLAILAVAVITIVNLRGIRESGSIFAVPTYLFVGLMFGLIGFGLLRVLNADLPVYQAPASTIVPGSQGLGLFLLLTAFAQGCTAMTGTEAISDGVPAFKPPEAANARTTILWMGIILGSMFTGLSFLASRIGIMPAANETVLSQVGRIVFGTGPLWAMLQLVTALILVLAANTAFADFPRLGSFLARDHFLPRAFRFRGDRLAFTTGIVVLALLASLLLIVFQGSLDHLIPLYAVGVFTSFTLSQTGMVMRWRRERGPNWRRSALVNGIGAVTTGLVTLVIALTKFTHGAWLVILLIPLLIGMFSAIRAHYRRLETASEAETPLAVSEVIVRAVVPLSDLGVPAQQALAYAGAIARDSHHVVAVHVVDTRADGERFRAEWEHGRLKADLVLIESPYRSLTGPLFAYVDALRETYPQDTITVVLPEYVASHWWEHLLHNHTALRIKAALLFHPGIVVTSVPYHLGTAHPATYSHTAMPGPTA